MTDFQLFVESLIYFSDNVLSEDLSHNPLYLSVFKNRMSELNECIQKNPILIQSLSHEQKVSLCGNIEQLKDKIEGDPAKEVMQKVSTYILSFLKKEFEVADSQLASLQTESLEVFIRVTLEKNIAHISDVAEALLSKPESLASLNPVLLNRFVLALAEVRLPLVLQNIRKFQIKDPEVHEQIAAIGLQTMPGWLCSCIQNLNLKTTTLEKIAREAASKAPSSLAAHVEKFHIEDPSILEELVMIIAEKDLSLLCPIIMDFHIGNEGFRRSLAARIAQEHPTLLAYNIKNFELFSEPDIEGILSKFAEIDPELVTEYFKVTPDIFESVVGKVALFVALEKPVLLMSYIEIFQLKDEDLLETLFIELAKSAPKYFLEKFQDFGIQRRSFLSKVIINMAIVHPDFTFDNLEKFVETPQELPQFLGIILEGYVEHYLSLAKDLSAFSPKDAEKFSGLWSKTATTLANTSKYRNKEVSVYLAKSFCYMFINYEPFKTRMLQLNGGNLVVYKIRPSILPAKWISEVKEETEELFRQIATITQFLNKRKRDFCEASPSNLSISLLHNYLLAARTLDLTSFSSEKKIALFSRVFSEEGASNEDVCQKLILLNILCSTKIDIESMSWSSKEDLIRILNETINDGSFGNLDDIEDLSTSYANTFGQLRIPYAIETYWACIKDTCDEDPLLQEAFEWFAHSVLKGTFQSERYRTDNNPHLKHLEDYDSALLAEWKRPLDCAALGLQSERGTVVETDDYQDLLFSGTEVPGSCLRIDGEAVKNKCLLAYLMDGKTRILAIKNPQTGKIVFRTVLRLLWDTKNNRPVLFQEFIYPAVNDREVEKILLQASIAKAKLLNIPLLVSSGGDAEMYVGNATSLGSSCPYEYVDSGGGVTEGRYSIQHAQVLFTPPPKSES